MGNVMLVDLIEADLDRDEDESVGGPVLSGATIQRYRDAGVMTDNEASQWSLPLVVNFK